MKYVALSSVSSRLVSNSGLYPDMEDVVTLVGNFMSYSVKMYFSTVFKAPCTHLLEEKLYAFTLLLSVTALIYPPG